MWGSIRGIQSRKNKRGKRQRFLKISVRIGIGKSEPFCPKPIVSTSGLPTIPNYWPFIPEYPASIVLLLMSFRNHTKIEMK
jgi:hypothetical protein